MKMGENGSRDVEAQAEKSYYLCQHDGERHLTVVETEEAILVESLKEQIEKQQYFICYM